MPNTVNLPNTSLFTGTHLAVMTLAGAPQSTALLIGTDKYHPRELHFITQGDYTLTMTDGSTVLLALTTLTVSVPYYLSNGGVVSINAAAGTVVLNY